MHQCDAASYKHVARGVYKAFHQRFLPSSGILGVREFHQGFRTPLFVKQHSTILMLTFSKALSLIGFASSWRAADSKCCHLPARRGQP
jgi:hypothetical protein